MARSRRDPLSPIPPSKNPFQFWMFVAFAVAGTADFFTGFLYALHAPLPLYAARSWDLMALIGGVVGVVVPWMKDRVSGLLLERLALASVGMATVIYVFMGGFYIFSRDGVTGIPFASILAVGSGIAALWRARQVTRELEMIQHALREGL